MTEEPKDPGETERSPDGDSRELPSFFTHSIGGKRERSLEPVQLVVTVYRPELEHLDRIRNRLQEKGFGDLSRDELVRYGINLLHERDFRSG